MSSLLRIDQRQEDQNLARIETEIIRPIQINENSCTFIFRNKGLLDKKTTISVPVVANTDADDAGAAYQLPITTGIMSCVKDAFLRAGGVTIASTIDVNQHYACTTNFKSLESRGNLEAARKGVLTEYGVSPVTASTNPSGGGNYCQGSACVWGQVKYDIPVATDTVRTGTGQSPYILTQTSATTARFYFTLEDLFPHLFQVLMMPLGLVTEEVSLTIRWAANQAPTASTGNDRAIKTTAAAPSDETGTVRLLTNEVEMLCDYLFYEDMSPIASEVMSQQGLVMDYADLITNKLVIQKLASDPPTAQFTRQTNSRQLGLTGRTLRYMLFAFNIDGEYHPLCSKYYSDIGSQKQNGESIQIKINNQPLLQTPAVHDGYKYGLLEEVFGLPLMVPNAMFSSEGQYYDNEAADRSETTDPKLYTKWWNNLGMSRDTLWSHPQTELVGKGHYLGFNLHKPVYTPDGRLQRANVPGSGILISETPIQVDYIREVVGDNNPATAGDAWYSRSDNLQKQMYVFCCVEKRTVLKDGKFSTTQS